ncbi:hypothetical protein GE09DRAFT_1152963 [Coniochaeta sp. 2T2.1]|nr:hypothetical protein GE09DRAFT_1152963 [Coniochaeta sp. 2T2.1]
MRKAGRGKAGRTKDERTRMSSQPRGRRDTRTSGGRWAAYRGDEEEAGLLEDVDENKDEQKDEKKEQSPGLPEDEKPGTEETRKRPEDDEDNKDSPDVPTSRRIPRKLRTTTPQSFSGRKTKAEETEGWKNDGLTTPRARRRCRRGRPGRPGRREHRFYIRREPRRELQPAFQPLKT